MDATADNREKLEAWILEYYAASAFNTCRRQKMPSTKGPPVKIMVDPGATPVAILKPIPVPLHYRAEVKTALDADVARGVLERVPPGTPTTWCARMLIQPKKDGGARRLVDLSALTKVCAREIHHTRSLFKVAGSIPANTLRTTLDCKDGYHGVEIREEDREKTSFLTEWGCYRYRRCPQGLAVSGDGYTKRTDEILSSTPDKPGMMDIEKIVDDVCQWSDTMSILQSL